MILGFFLFSLKAAVLVHLNDADIIDKRHTGILQNIVKSLRTGEIFA